jgi:SAM-dependent methyltransferase
MPARVVSPESPIPKAMETHEQEYCDYLERKYLPGRRLYLHRVFYPKLFRRFKSGDPIIDLGCGTGEFLNYCRKRNRQALGIDSNEVLAKRCKENGLNVHLDSVCELSSLKHQHFRYAVCDNVLEHLELAELNQFFDRLETLLSPGGILICIVPGRKGFKCDPTHKTYVSYELLSDLLKNRNLKLGAHYYHPLRLGFVDRLLYLNMQVFEINKPHASDRKNNT